VSKYCHKFKGMADALADLGSLVDDWILVLNILRSLNQRFEHVRAIIQCYLPFPNFLMVQDDLLPEEIHLDTFGPAAAPTAFYSNNTSSAPLPPPLVSRPPGKTSGSGPGNGNDSNNNRNKNNRRNGGTGGRNNNTGGNRGGNTSSNTTAASNDATTNDGQGPPWPTYVNPWQGHFAIYPCLVPTGQQRPQAFLAAPGRYTPPGFMPGQQ
jgi:hypothetical protein